MEQGSRTLEEQKKEFKQNKLLATPIAGLIAWLIVFISGTQICIYPLAIVVIYVITIIILNNRTKGKSISISLH